MNFLKAIIIDLDGTLLNDDKEVSKKDVQTLHKLGQLNVKRIIATGRSLYSVNEVLSKDFPIDYLIFDAGAGILNFKTKEIAKSYSINYEDVIAITNKLLNLRLDFQVRNKIPESHKYIFKKFSKNNPDFDRINTIYKNHCKEFSDYTELKEATRFICISQNDKIVKTIETEFNDFGIIRATSPIDKKSVWMEIYPKGVNKGSSLKWLCNKLNINLKETAGLGNDYNDIDFLDICEKSYVVENSPKILKDKYHVTVNNNESPLYSLISENTF